MAACVRQHWTFENFNLICRTNMFIFFITRYCFGFGISTGTTGYRTHTSVENLKIMIPSPWQYGNITMLISSEGACWDSWKEQSHNCQCDRESWQSGGHTGGEYGPNQLRKRNQRLQGLFSSYILKWLCALTYIWRVCLTITRLYCCRLYKPKNSQIRCEIKLGCRYEF